MGKISKQNWVVGSVILSASVVITLTLSLVVDRVTGIPFGALDLKSPSAIKAIVVQMSTPKLSSAHQQALVLAQVERVEFYLDERTLTGNLHACFTYLSGEVKCQAQLRLAQYQVVPAVRTLVGGKWRLGYDELATARYSLPIHHQPNVNHQKRQTPVQLDHRPLYSHSPSH